jgi:hypothetical protein
MLLDRRHIEMIRKPLWTGICLLLIAGMANALVVKMDTPELTEKAKQIVIGHVVNVQSEWHDENQMIFTYVSVQVEEFVKGTGRNTVTVKIPGGTLEDQDLRLWVSDIPEFSIGERVVLFLKDMTPHTNLLGLFQGKYTVVDDRVLERDIELDEFLNEIRFHLR